MTKLLIVADIEDKCAATPRGLALAEEMDLQPEVVAFTYADIKRLRVDKPQADQIKKQLLAERKATVEARIARYVSDSTKVKCHVVWAEDIHKWICKRAEGDYAAVVKSRHSSASLAHIPTDWHLLRTCPAPVLLVGKKKAKKASPIVATVDLDATSRVKQRLNVDVVFEARHYAEIFDTELVVLCVVEVPALLADLDLVDARSWAQKREQELQSGMRELAEATGLPESAFVFKRGPTAKTIVSEASRLKAQLVVMGTVGRRGVSAQVIGNTAEQVLQLLKIDTLTIKP